MRARHRHLNPKGAGAIRAYDSRFVSGTNNSGLQTWTDRCGNSNAVQNNSANRALFIAAGQGGCPIVRFDGSNDFYTIGRINTGSGITAIATHKVSNDGILLGSQLSPGNVNSQIIRLKDSKCSWYNDSTSNPDTTHYLSANTSDWSIFGVASVSAFPSQPLKSFRDGVNLGDSSSNVNPTNSNFYEFGAIFGGIAAVNGDVGQTMIILSDISSSPIRKRLEHAAAYSFKFPCS